MCDMILNTVRYFCHFMVTLVRKGNVPVRLQTDKQTDGQPDSSIPPHNFVAGGLKTSAKNTRYTACCT
jgi:hypothetical protein